MSKIHDSLLGLAVGDAIGVPIETYKREELKLKPITEMKGFMAHDIPKGYWSDDTSMTIATIESIISKKCFDYNDIMNNFTLWLYKGKFTPNGTTFGIGNTCKKSIDNYYINKKDVFECGIDNINNNGNGSIMRMLPAALYCYYKKSNDNEILDIVKKLSSLTHKHEISIIGCYIYTKYLIYLLKGYNKIESYNMIQKLNYSMFTTEYLEKYDRILNDQIYDFNEDDISSLWYVVDTLESSLYCLINTNSYKDAIIKAINLGGDTDTVGAVTGAMAGILYGKKNIPISWINDIYNIKYLIKICDNFEKILFKFS